MSVHNRHIRDAWATYTHPDNTQYSKGTRPLFHSEPFYLRSSVVSISPSTGVGRLRRQSLDGIFTKGRDNEGVLCGVQRSHGRWVFVECRSI